MTLTEIKTAISLGYKVHWSNPAYVIILDSVGQYLIHCKINDYYIGLTWLDGVTLNGEEHDFYIGEL